MSKDNSDEETPNWRELEDYKSCLQLNIEKYKSSSQIQLEQYRNLRAEIIDKIKSMGQVEFYAITGVAIYYGWIFNHCAVYNSKTMQVMSWIFPIIIPILGIWRNEEHARAVTRIAKYIVSIEQKFLTDGYPIGPETGWETHLDNQRKKRVGVYERFLWGSIFKIFWIVLSVIVLGLAAAGLLIQYPLCKG